MLIYAIDDEPRLLRALHKAIVKAEPQAEVMDFSLAVEAVRAIEAGGPCPDIVFSDIRMPQMDGLALAARLKTLAPRAKVVFVTGYEEYSLDAYRLHASGYVTKPVEVARVREEIENAMPDRAAAPTPRAKRIEIKTFGNFEILVDGETLSFRRAKSKELLAYLVDQQGQGVSRSEIHTALWEEGDYDLSRQKYLDVIIRSLRDTLAAYGVEDILELKSGFLRVRPERLDCDLYSFLKGDPAAVNAYRGRYMNNYSWAVLGEAKLTRLRNEI